MKHGYLALAALTACAGLDSTSDPASGGGGKADSPTAFSHVATAWELKVGGGGDAVVATVKEMSDSTLLATSFYPRWVMRSTPTGERVASFGRGYEDLFGSHYEGAVKANASEVWETDANNLVAAIRFDTGVYSQLQRWTNDGRPDPGFGNAGVVLLPGYLFEEGDVDTVAVEYDAARARIVVLVVRDWQKKNLNGGGGGQPGTIGPKTLELVAYDARTGAQSSLGTFTLPDWEYSWSHNVARLRELLVQPDGSFLVFASNLLYIPNTDGSNGGTSPADRWSVFHLVPGSAPVQTSLAITTGYQTDMKSFVRLGGGRFDFYMNGIVQDVSADDGDRRLVRISLDSSSAPRLEDLGPALDFEHGCARSTASANMFVFAHAPDETKPLEFTAYPKDREPFTFTSDRPKRCVLGLSIGRAGRLYASTWDTTDSAYKALLTALVPE